LVSAKNVIDANDIRYSSSYGIFSNSNTSLRNTVGNNNLYKNRHDIVAANSTQKLSAKN
jgi:hypothetical protein